MQCQIFAAEVRCSVGEMGNELGRWDPLDLSVVVGLFAPAEFRWWVTGGHALELHVDRRWRPHADIDISFCRQDSAGVRRLLSGWDIHVAAGGRLTPWDGGSLRQELHQNNLWCRRTPFGPWVLDLAVSDGDDTSWIFRRDSSLRLLWAQAVLYSASSVPYLAPELQLLFKSKNPRAKDDEDLLEVLPHLDANQVDLLAARLPRDHPWQPHIAAR